MLDGTKLGKSEGCRVGSWLNDAVGWSEGEMLGWFDVGLNEGNSDGYREGSCDGKDVGCDEGSKEGEALGLFWTVGDIDGLPVGDIVGLSVGLKLARVVGTLEGPKDGVTLG